MSAEQSGAPGEADVGADPAADVSTLSRGALEAVLLVSDEPVPVVTLAAVFTAPQEEVTAALVRLAAEHDARAGGIELRVTEAGWRLHTRPEHVDAVERFLREGQRVRLTQAGLEALAVVAYAQPTTRGHVSAVRGVASDGVLRTLVVRGLIEEAGTEPSTGATTYRTTALLLERLGIGSLAELPALAPHLPDLAELDDPAANPFAEAGPGVTDPFAEARTATAVSSGAPVTENGGDEY